MNKHKLDALLWEHIPFEDLVFQGVTKLTQENMDDLPIDDIDEFHLSRDEGYNIQIICVRKLNKVGKKTLSRHNVKKDYIAGETVAPGKIEVNLFGSYCIELSPCYINESSGSLEKVEYKLGCYHVEGKNVEKTPTVLKEWVLNGSRTGMSFCGNSEFKYTVDGTVSGEYGDMSFPISETQNEQEYMGYFTHINFKDTAFDIHYVGSNYGPKWSDSFSISYFEKYGRIPNDEERALIRDYLSFFMGKHLMYIGNSSYDDMGNQIGFVMENPRTFGFDIESICRNAATPPVSCEFDSIQYYIDTVQKYIVPFGEMYFKLDFSSLITSYWYASNIAKPMDLPILAGALEHLKRQWYKEVELNPETVLMDKKEFSKLIGPVKELVVKQFSETEYSERMKRMIESLNRMSVNEQLTHFFDRIGIVVGRVENDALKARNLPAHGNVGDADFEKQYKQSKVYECILCRVLLKLIGYDGEYVDYGMLGHPCKSINIPSGE